MEAIKFEETNRVWAENQPDYTPLPACVYKETEDAEAAISVHCFKLSPTEVSKIVATGKIWHRTFVGAHIVPFNIMAIGNYFTAQDVIEEVTPEEVEAYPETKYEAVQFFGIPRSWKNFWKFVTGKGVVEIKVTLKTKGVLLKNPDVDISQL